MGVNFFDVEYFFKNITNSLFAVVFVLALVIGYNFFKKSADDIFLPKEGFVETPIEFDMADSLVVKKLPFIAKGENLPKGLAEIDWRKLNSNLFADSNLNLWRWFPGDYAVEEDYITKGTLYIYSESLGVKIPLAYRTFVEKSCFTSDEIVYKNGSFVIKTKKVSIWHCIRSGIVAIVIIIALIALFSYVGAGAVAFIITVISYYAIRIINRKNFYKEVWYEEDLADYLKKKGVFLVVKNASYYLIYRYKDIVE